MEKEKYLQNTHLFIPAEYMNFEMQENGGIPLIIGPNFSFDVIEQPFHCAVSSTDDELVLKLYIRNQIYLLDTPDVGITFFKEPKDGKSLNVFANNGIIGDISNAVTLFLHAIKELSVYVDNNSIQAELSNIDTTSEGFLLEVDGENLNFKKVSGKDRPTLACRTLFEGIQMMRPYKDEVMDSWEAELLPLEEKIELAEQGDETMMEQLAMLYLNGDEDEEIEQDAEKAFYWFNKLAEAENSDGAFNVGLFYAKGFGVERDFLKAAEWMDKAEEYGDFDAPEAAEKYRKVYDDLKLAEQGDAAAQARLAEIFMEMARSLDQAGGGNDYAEALKWAEKSAAQNNGDGVWILALAYEHGRGVKQNVKKAIELYKQGAELGHAKSQNSLGGYYMRGDHIKTDEKKGFELIKKSAEQGYGLAMQNLGRCYQFGNGVEDDMSKAIEWYEKSLEVDFDPELAQKVAIFKQLEENGGFLPESEENDEEDDSTYPSGTMEALQLFEFVDELGYTDSTDERGVFSIDDKMIEFATKVATEGNEECQLILSQYFLANECTDEQYEQAVSWLKSLSKKGNEDAENLLLDIGK